MYELPPEPEQGFATNQAIAALLVFLLVLAMLGCSRENTAADQLKKQTVWYQRAYSWCAGQVAGFDKE